MPLVVQATKFHMLGTMRHVYGLILVAILIVLAFSPVWLPRLRAELVHHASVVTVHSPQS